MKITTMVAATVILALLAIATAIPTATATTTKVRRWPKPTELNTNDNFGDNKAGWAYACVEDPTTPPSPMPLPPGIPDIGKLLPPGFPDIGKLLPPIFPGIGGGAPSHFPVSTTESNSISKCMNHHPKAKDCYAQILNSYVSSDLHLDYECCKMVVLMDDECNDVVYSNFKSTFFPRLLQYSCHLKHKN